MKNPEAAQIQFKRMQLLKTMRMGLVNLLQTSDERTADAMTEAIFTGLVLLNAQQEKEKTVTSRRLLKAVEKIRRKARRKQK